MKIKDLEQEYWDDKVVYAGCSAKNSPQELYLESVCDTHLFEDVDSSLLEWISKIDTSSVKDWV